MHLTVMAYGEVLNPDLKEQMVITSQESVLCPMLFAMLFTFTIIVAISLENYVLYPASKHCLSCSP